MTASSDRYESKKKNTLAGDSDKRESVKKESNFPVTNMHGGHFLLPSIAFKPGQAGKVFEKQNRKTTGSQSRLRPRDIGLFLG